MKIKKYCSYNLVLITLIISSCGDSNVEKFDADKSIYSPKDYAYNQTIKREGSFLREMLGVGKNNKTNNNQLLNINPYLWNASLNILSAAMPLVSIDSASGIIISDWYSLKGKPNERVKISVLVNSEELRADGLNIKVFKQILKGNSWLSAEINPNIAVNLERKIVHKAGMLSNQKD